MEQFDIIEYLSGLTSFAFDKAVLKRIALERGVYDVTAFDELDDKTKELLYADVLFAAYVSPTSSSSITKQHGAFSQTIGSQTINDRKYLYNIFVPIYRKWEDEKLAVVETMQGGLRWLDY